MALAWAGVDPPPALLPDEFTGPRIPLTGPQAFTNAELVEVIGAVLGRPLRYREIPADVVRQRFIGLGFTAEFADAYTAMLQAAVVMAWTSVDAATDPETRRYVLKGIAD